MSYSSYYSPPPAYAPSKPALWDPATVLDFSLGQCSGITKQGRGCRNRVNAGDTSQARSLLNSMSKLSPSDDEVLDCLADVAGLTLCLQWHRHRLPQGPQTVERWRRAIKNYEALHYKKTTTKKTNTVKHSYGNSSSLTSATITPPITPPRERENPVSTTRSVVYTPATPDSEARNYEFTFASAYGIPTPPSNTQINSWSGSLNYNASPVTPSKTVKKEGPEIKVKEVKVEETSDASPFIDSKTSPQWVTTDEVTSKCERTSSTTKVPRVVKIEPQTSPRLSRAHASSSSSPGNDARLDDSDTEEEAHDSDEEDKVDEDEEDDEDDDDDSESEDEDLDEELSDDESLNEENPPTANSRGKAKEELVEPKPLNEDVENSSKLKETSPTKEHSLVVLPSVPSKLLEQTVSTLMTEPMSNMTPGARVTVYAPVIEFPAASSEPTGVKPEVSGELATRKPGEGELSPAGLEATPSSISPPPDTTKQVKPAFTTSSTPIPPTHVPATSNLTTIQPIFETMSIAPSSASALSEATANEQTSPGIHRREIGIECGCFSPIKFYIAVEKSIPSVEPEPKPKGESKWARVRKACKKIVRRPDSKETDGLLQEKGGSA